MERFDAASEFPSHHHPSGEEIFALDRFLDEFEIYVASAWILSLPYSSQKMTLENGAILSVHLDGLEV